MKAVKWNWKALFISLLIANAIVLLSMIILILFPSKEPQKSREEQHLQGEVQFSVVFDKDNLSRLINQHLQEIAVSNRALGFLISFDDYVHLAGEIEAFGMKAPYELTFEPKVNTNGDLLLLQRSMNLGRLKLPVRFVLEALEKKQDIPEWVKIYPENKAIVIQFDAIKTISNYKIKIQEFNLGQDRMVFRVYMQ